MNAFEIKHASGKITIVHTSATDLRAFWLAHFGVEWPEGPDYPVTVRALGPAEAFPRTPIVHEAFGAVAGAGASSSGG